jgi:hypothetical protein
MVEPIRNTYFTMLDADIDPIEQAEQLAANLMSFRLHPHRGRYFAISMVRSYYEGESLAAATRSHRERTAAQLDILAIKTMHETIDFIAFCTGYLAARMFLPALAPSPNLSRFLLPDQHQVADETRKQSVAKSTAYMPALSEIHDNRAAPRDSRLVHRLLAEYLEVLIEDPRPSTLEAIIGRSYEASTHFSARQIAETLDRARLWATLGWRRGQAERRFRLEPRGIYLQNIAGDVRVAIDRAARTASFADLRRVRLLALPDIEAQPHPCDDAAVTQWIARNVALAQRCL